MYRRISVMPKGYTSYTLVVCDICFKKICKWEEVRVYEIWDNYDDIPGFLKEIVCDCEFPRW
jgi:hypothetical protein